MARRAGFELANPLSRFRTYSYHHMLVVCDSTQTAREVNLAIQQSPNNFKVIDVKEGQSFTPSTTESGGKYAVLCNGLTTARFYIESVKWSTVMVDQKRVDDGTIVQTSGEEGIINVVEPIGVGFYNALAVAFDALHTDPSGAVFLLKTIFYGHTDEEGGGEFIFNTRPTFFNLIWIESDFGIKGSTYVLTVVGMTDGMGHTPQITSIAEGISLSLDKGGQTLFEAMMKLQSELNLSYQKSIEKMQSAAISNGCTSLNLEEYRTMKYVIELPEVYLDNKYLVDTPLQNISNSGNKDFIFSFGKKATVELVIQDILQSCSKILEEGKGTPNKDGLISVYIARVSSEFTSDSKNGIMTYKIYRHESLINPVNPPTPDAKTEAPKPSKFNKGQVNSQTAQTAITNLIGQTDINNLNIMDTDKLQALRNTPDVIHFDYIFTGRNVDIEDFQMKMDLGMSFLQALTIQGSISSQTQTLTNDTGMGSAKSGMGGYTKINKSNNVRDKSILYYNMQSRDTFSRHTSAPHNTLSYRAMLSNYAAFQNIQANVSINGNPDLIPGSFAIAATSDGATRFNNIPRFCTINIKYPDSEYPDGDYKFNTFWFDGMYFILTIEHVFEGGKFTQNLDLVSLPDDAVYKKQEANFSRDCFSMQPISSGGTASSNSGDTLSNNGPVQQIFNSYKGKLDPNKLSARGKENYQLLQNPKVQATLAMIRKGEGTFDQGGYSRMFGGKQFTDFSKHPNVAIRSGKYKSTASGAYQFLNKTWNGLTNKLGLTDFSPESQDIAAVELLRQRGAMKYIENGDVRGTLNSISGEWASMPMYNGNSRYGQPVKSVGDLQQVYNNYLSGKGGPSFAVLSNNPTTPQTVSAPTSETPKENPQQKPLDKMSVADRMKSHFTSGSNT